MSVAATDSYKKNLKNINRFVCCLMMDNFGYSKKDYTWHVLIQNNTYNIYILHNEMYRSTMCALNILGIPNRNSKFNLIIKFRELFPLNDNKEEEKKEAKPLTALQLDVGLRKICQQIILENKHKSLCSRLLLYITKEIKFR